MSRRRSIQVNVLIWSFVAAAFLVVQVNCGCEKASYDMDSTTIELPTLTDVEEPDLPEEFVEMEEGPDAAKKRLIELQKGFQYNPVGKRDPFRSFVVMRPTEKKYVGSKVLTPLQRYELAQLNLVGIINGPKDKHGLVEDASGKGYVVRVGTYVGKNGGRVIEVRDGELVIEEFYTDYFGREQSESVSMKLQKGNEGESL